MRGASRGPISGLHDFERQIMREALSGGRRQARPIAAGVSGRCANNSGALINLISMNPEKYML